jgi:predicted nucleic acid-binding protein
MSLLVDTSVWSLAFRRDVGHPAPQVVVLRKALEGARLVVTTGFVVQELVQGFAGPRDRARLLERLSALTFVHPDLADHIAAAEVRNACRRKGVQVGTIDALLIQLCRRHSLELLTSDGDFAAAREHVGFGLWSG